MLYPEPIAKLVEELSRLPGIGPKSAQRLALHIIHRPREEAARLADAIVKARNQIRTCSICCNLTVTDPCHICTDTRRARDVLCVVEEAKDVIAMERTHEFRGLYHVLQGSLSPLEGRGPEQLRIRELLQRLQGEDGKTVEEVILATDPDVEGEATALYLARLLRDVTDVKVTRIARGLPEGGDLDYVDVVTLSRALEGRRELS